MKSIKANLTSRPTKDLPPARAKRERKPNRVKWDMPDAKELFAFINSTPLVASLLYDINLLPEEIDNARDWNHMLAVCVHMEQALASNPASKP